MMQHQDNRVNDAAGHYQLDFETPTRRHSTAGQTRSRTRVGAEGPRPLCVVCGRSRARLTLTRSPGQAPVRLCLRCHHGVMQQRKMLRAGLAPDHRRHHVVGDAGLIVPRGTQLSAEAKYHTLTHRRRRAQVAARLALDAEVGAEQRVSARRPDLLDRAS